MTADDARDRESAKEEGSGTASSVTSSGPIAAAPMADPGPASLGAFGITFGLLSIVNAGLVDPGVLGAFIPLAFFAGGLLLLLGGLISFRANEVFTATVFSSYAMFWISLAFFFFFAERLALTDPAVQGPAVGLTLLMWTIFTVFVWIASIKTNWTIFVTFTVLLAAFIVLTIGFWTGNAGLIQIGGYLGILDSALAFYLAGAGLINPMFGRDVLPVK